MKGFKNFLLESKNKYDHSCVMYKLPSLIVKNINNWSRLNIPEKNLYHEGEDRGRVEDLHITILYGLHTNNYKKIKECIKYNNSLKIKFGLVTKFKKKEFDVIKIDIESPGLERLNLKLKNLPHTEEYKEFRPHCTLAYVETGSCDHLIENEYFKDKTFIVSDIIFSNSKGEQILI